MKKLNIFITGASSGIGASTVKALCASGHNVLGVARNREKLETLSAECSALDGEFAFFEGDVVSAEDQTIAVEFALEKFGRLDVVIPNAGIGYFDPLEVGALEEWKAMIDVNIMGVLGTIHTCLPHLIKSKGQVINIGSVAARQVFPNSGIYCATKHFILALSESLRLEFSNKISVTTINPGAVNTEFILRTTNTDLREEYKPNFDSGMSPDFVAEAIVNAVEARGKGIYSEITLRPDRI
jgi:NADP-dependent 3-hydroxy acid dehydrogenase YdfG